MAVAGTANREFETTVRRPVRVTGIGLHSGVEVSLGILPAKAGEGIRFLRTDLDGFSIPANWKFVARVSYATSLMRQGVLLSTTEHVLSVLYSMGIDNARIEISNLEVPILDGSGKPFIELLSKAGVKQLKRHRRHLRILRAVEVTDGDKRIAIVPAEAFRITCETNYGHPLAGRQTLELELTPETYAEQIAPARTFGFANDLDRMRDMGLIRGASLDNAICFNGNAILNPGGLRFPDECCRHKVLDLIGDLALIGHPLQAHVIAQRAGHAMHTALVSKIMHDPTCYELTSSSTGEHIRVAEAAAT
jgi:UDP-3-O-[3-hydroxymyristoyl] N-acetylglucosamine deacetylase